MFRIQWPRAATAVLASLLWTTAASGQTAARAHSSPQLQPSDCPFHASQAVLEQIRCGYLLVPENRAVPEGRQLRLAVAVLKSVSRTPRPDPVVFLSGGPGGAALEGVPERASNPIWNRIRQERDVVFFDQRGTGHSDPDFCPEVTEEYTRLLFLGLSPEERTERMRAVLGRCARLMADAGVDLSQYNSVASALDLDDLRRALGYEQWNLLGVSYGSRLGLEAMRIAPVGIRSAVLDAPAPPNVRGEGRRAAHLADVVRRLGLACEADPVCAASHPDLEETIWRTAEELDQDPWIISGDLPVGAADTLVVDGYLFASALYQGLYDRRFIPLAPQFVAEIGRHNEAMVRAMASRLSGTARTLDRALNLAVQCFEALPMRDPGSSGVGRDYPEILGRVQFGENFVTPAVCDAWHPFRGGPELAAPVSSDVPTLVFTGEFDPATHRSQGALAVAGLSRGYVVDVPAMGHGASPHHPCTRSMMFAFFDDPSVPPDTSCIGTMEPVRFADVRVTRGISRITSWLNAPNASLAGAGLLGLPLVILFGSTAGWPLAAGARLLRRRHRPSQTAFERRARWGAAGFVLIALAFAGGLGWAFQWTVAQNPVMLAFGLPDQLAPLLVVPWILLIWSLGLFVATAIAWRRGAWTRTGRIQFTGVALASATLVAGLFWIGLV